jgi:dCMP deaminase
MTRPNWDEYFLGVAHAVKLRSDCERDKVGAVIVDGTNRIIATGYNGAPSGHDGCRSCPRRTSGVAPGSPYSNCVAVHAEANAIVFCSYPDRTQPRTIYVTRQPCVDCAKLIAAAGINRVVTPDIFSN